MKKNQNSELLNLNAQGYLFQCLDDPFSGYLLRWLDRRFVSRRGKCNPEADRSGEGFGEGYRMGRGSRWEYFRAIFFRYRAHPTHCFGIAAREPGFTADLRNIFLVSASLDGYPRIHREKSKLLSIDLASNHSESERS